LIEDFNIWDIKIEVMEGGCIRVIKKTQGKVQKIPMTETVEGKTFNKTRLVK
jgi:hypothetical protein